MTVIVGIVDKKTHKVYIGGDQGYFDSEEYVISNNPKVFKKHIGKNTSIVIGNCGSGRIGDILEHWNVSKLDYMDTLTPRGFIVKKFIPELKKVLGKDATKEEFSLMIGFMGNLFVIQADFSVLVPDDHGVAIGSAASPAQGVIVALSKIKTNLSTKKKILLAIQTSMQISHFAKGNIDILSI